MNFLKYLSHDDETMSDYNSRQIQIADMNSALIQSEQKGRIECKREGRKEGERKGIKKGKIEGERTKAIEMAKKMLKDGMIIDIISKYSGLSIKEIKNLK